MHLKVLLPYKVFCLCSGVSRIVTETTHGSLGLLPHRLDCVAALVPGILSFENDQGKEIFVAVDRGVLVKTGTDVMISVRNAIGGQSLPQLHETIEKEFLKLKKEDRSTQEVMAKMENGLIRRFAEFQHE